VQKHGMKSDQSSRKLFVEVNLVSTCNTKASICSMVKNEGLLNNRGEIN
jgi:hypothetical protein